MRLIGLLCSGWMLILTGAGCTSSHGNIDPWEKTNRKFYKFDDDIDRKFLEPAANFYVKAVPEPIRTGLGNGIDNLQYFNVVLNDFLQGKGRQGLGDATRMAVNSTIGIAGIFDVATKWNLPSHENDFGTTLGKWGVEPGPYLMLPLLGPATLRDTPGFLVANATNPVTWLSPPLYATIPLGGVEAMDRRSRVESVVRFRNAAAIDPYIFTRDAYLQYRENLVHEHSRPVDPSIYDEPESAPAKR